MSIIESDASCGGQQSGDVGAHWSEAPRKHQEAREEEVAEADVVDLVLQVHAKLTVQLESRMRDVEASMYCTVLLPSESDIVEEIRGADRLHSDMVEKSQMWKEKPAHMVLQRHAESHREDSRGQGCGPEPLEPREVGGPSRHSGRSPTKRSSTN